jgi:hypothetical protein
MVNSHEKGRGGIHVTRRKTMKYYKAPWRGWLVGLSVFHTLLFLGGAAYTLRRGNWFLSLALVALMLGCALFCIRGYTVTPDVILVHRLFWVTRLPLTDLQSAQTLPRGLSWWGIRIGNGGFFSFSGWSYVPGRGFYRVYVTDPNHKVLLRFARCQVVVSPCAPEEFIHQLPLPSHAA